MIIGSISEPQTAPEQKIKEKPPEQTVSEQSKTAAEELIREAKELRNAKEKTEISDEFKEYSEACQAGCESMFPTDDMEYTECVVTCVLG